MKLAFSGATDDVTGLTSGFGGVGFDGLQLKWNQFADYLDRPEAFCDMFDHLEGVAPNGQDGHGRKDGGHH